MDLNVQQLPSTPHQTMDAVELTFIDRQIATAKQYPRSNKRVTEESIGIVTLSKEVAGTCSYALPRGGKPITGPSIHLAKILAQQYGNLRAEAKVVEITERQVVSRGTAWDLENNYAVAFEVRRSIWGNRGRYTDDMITVTGNAANAIAYRNAVFAVIPKAIIDTVSLAAQQTITGDLSDETVLIARRIKMIDYFRDEYNITEDELIKLVGKHTVGGLGKDQIVLLLSIDQALKDGDTTVDLLLKDIRVKLDSKVNVGNDKKAALKSKQKTTSKAKTKAATNPTILP